MPLLAALPPALFPAAVEDVVYKGSTVDQHGARQRTAPFEDFYALNSTKVAEFPLAKHRPLALARTLDVTVVAEGVECAAQAEYLRAAGVRFAQGWLFGRPMAAAELTALIALEAGPASGSQGLRAR